MVWADVFSLLWEKIWRDTVRYLDPRTWSTRAHFAEQISLFTDMDTDVTDGNHANDAGMVIRHRGRPSGIPQRSTYRIRGTALSWSRSRRAILPRRFASSYLTSCSHDFPRRYLERWLNIHFSRTKPTKDGTSVLNACPAEVLEFRLKLIYDRRNRSKFRSWRGGGLAPGFRNFRSIIVLGVA